MKHRIVTIGTVVFSILFLCLACQGIMAEEQTYGTETSELLMKTITTDNLVAAQTAFNEALVKMEKARAALNQAQAAKIVLDKFEATQSAIKKVEAKRQNSEASADKLTTDKVAATQAQADKSKAAYEKAKDVAAKSTGQVLKAAGVGHDISIKLLTVGAAVLCWKEASDAADKFLKDQAAVEKAKADARAEKEAADQIAADEARAKKIAADQIEANRIRIKKEDDAARDRLEKEKEGRKLMESKPDPKNRGDGYVPKRNGRGEKLDQG
ncbi:MAG: hypothetical protein WCX71_02285 [Candidatus Buchananbacteria bacterium]